KAELIATLAYASEDTLLVCNGCKDAVMMRLMLEGQELNRDIVPVLERYDEFEQFVALVPEVEGSGRFGVRVRLSTSGAGLWSESGGENSKFGLSLSELMELVRRLEESPSPPEFRLLHFHLGSQIADLTNVRQATREAARIYASLHRRGIRIRYVDVGGGLGVPYEAGNPSVAGHINYGMRDYADAIVGELKRVCDEEGVPHPTIVSESGRAVTAFHSVLNVEALDVRAKGVVSEDESVDGPSPLPQFSSLLERVRSDVRTWTTDALEAEYLEAEAMRNAAIEAFRNGNLSLDEKALADRAFWTICHWIRERFERYARDETPPDSLKALFGLLPDHYLCNFSVFRSVVDHWAIGQRFPIMPIHRLDEPPTRRGILVDLTCDSDGEISDFVAPRGEKQYLELHKPLEGEPYFIGIFLMGAYQDIMGDMHNLLGRVTEAHVYGDPDEPDNFYIEKVLDGATVEEQLALVQYFPNDLERRMNELVLSKVRSGALKPKEATLILEQYRQAFREYTYLNTDPASGKKRPVRGSRIRRTILPD
ncbi:MAG TPA: biosynthetic arginine decarboxylase, partial [Rhodothermales bacterium]